MPKAWISFFTWGMRFPFIFKEYTSYLNDPQLPIYSFIRGLIRLTIYHVFQGIYLPHPKTFTDLTFSMLFHVPAGCQT